MVETLIAELVKGDVDPSQVKRMIAYGMILKLGSEGNCRKGDRKNEGDEKTVVMENE